MPPVETPSHTYRLRKLAVDIDSVNRVVHGQPIGETEFTCQVYLDESPGVRLFRLVEHLPSESSGVLPV